MAFLIIYFEIFCFIIMHFCFSYLENEAHMNVGEM